MPSTIRGPQIITFYKPHFNFGLSLSLLKLENPNSFETCFNSHSFNAQPIAQKGTNVWTGERKSSISGTNEFEHFTFRRQFNPKKFLEQLNNAQCLGDKKIEIRTRQCWSSDADDCLVEIALIVFWFPLFIGYFGRKLWFTIAHHFTCFIYLQSFLPDTIRNKPFNTNRVCVDDIPRLSGAPFASGPQFDAVLRAHCLSFHARLTRNYNDYDAQAFVTRIGVSN